MLSAQIMNVPALSTSQNRTTFKVANGALKYNPSFL